MATQKPISTISYNTESFLKEKLETWLKAHIIQSYQYICHKGEDGDKDHIHLRVEPNKKLDPMELSEQLLEYQMGKDKPLGCRPWRPSTEEDWFLYVVHNETYLKLKYAGGDQREKLPYDWKDIKVPDNYDLEVAFIRALAKLKHTSSSMATQLTQGTKPIDLILQGENPYTVNAIMHALMGDEYNKLQDEISRLRDQNEALMNAIENFGLDIGRDDNGDICLRLP